MDTQSPTGSMGIEDYQPMSLLPNERDVFFWKAINRLFDVAIAKVPVGYEDNSGFHYGQHPAQSASEHSIHSITPD
jgi:hypothetical protein